MIHSNAIVMMARYKNYAVLLIGLPGNIELARQTAIDPLVLGWKF